MSRTYIGTIGETEFSGIETYRIGQAIGYPMDCDKGKRVYEVSPGVYQVESAKQRDARLKSYIDTLDI